MGLVLFLYNPKLLWKLLEKHPDKPWEWENIS